MPYLRSCLLGSMLFCQVPCKAVGDDYAATADAESALPVYLLRYKFSPEEELKYESVQTVTQTTVLPAGDKVDKSRVEQTRVFRIREVNDKGQAKASMQFERVHMESKTNDKEPIVFDSSMAPNDVPRIFRSTAANLKRAAPNFTLRPTGIEVSEEGVQQDPKTGSPCFMLPLPAEAIAEGDSWAVKMHVKVRLAPGVMREIRLLRSYKLKSVEADVANVEFVTSIQSPVKSPQVKALLLQATPAGKIQFDLKNGKVLRRELEFDRFALGAMGPNTMVTAKGRTVERLISKVDVARAESR